MDFVKRLLRGLFTRLYKVEVTGLEHFVNAGERLLIVANHTSFLDAPLLWAFLPGELTFAINTHVARALWWRPFLNVARVFPLDPTNPLSSKALTRYLQQNRKAVIFPEGRITVTGALMKIYDGSGMVADKANALVLPVRIDGAQYTPFSRLKGQVRRHWFPHIRLNVLPARSISAPAGVLGRDRRRYAGRVLADLMTEMVFSTSDYRRSIFAALLDARRLNGGRHRIVEDIQRQPLNYSQLIRRSLILGALLAHRTRSGERVGVLLPNSVAAIAIFMGLLAYRRVPAMLNFTVGASGLLSGCETAQLRTVISAQRFVAAAKLQGAIGRLSEKLAIVYLEDLSREAGFLDKLKVVWRSWFARWWYEGQAERASPDDAAVVLFTSGSEGMPKGVALSHANLLANREQLAARFDFNAHDVILNALPLFHSFGLSAGALLPLLSGMRVFFYPSPLHYRIVPEVAYSINATIVFGTNTFLAGYARHAHPYDFYSARYVFAGAEKLQDDTRWIWASKFGVRILEGYGATETSPALAANTPMEHREGTVGRFLPGVQHQLISVPGANVGGRLHVKGPNVMLGYLLPERPGELVPPCSELGEGWYDTGDIVTIDVDGYVRICGRAKRFAKVGGEMVSLAAVEELAAKLWPAAQHAAVALADKQKGEVIALLTSQTDAERQAIVGYARENGVGEINIPKCVLRTDCLPLAGSGKVDYARVAEVVSERLSA
ncbi:MAG: AMP-binding protein [Gammaproteobacteria bacterium]